MLSNNKKLISILKSGGTAVIPTDTIYGLSAQALKRASVEKIYQLKKRRPEKPMVILISGIDNLSLFEIKISLSTRKILEKVWPGKVSVVLPCPYSKFRHLHRGTNTLAFRLPARQDLQELIKETGPLVSTSANPERCFPVFTISDIKKYFGDKVDIYIDEGKLESLPSTLISLVGEKVKILRQGEVKID